ncbi:hypothetical protein [Peribacillus simplex]|uniref:hypothetical protein n=1 Tax=Peribacillus simplex TaxID=1478 RepID=UPI00333AF420
MNSMLLLVSLGPLLVSFELLLVNLKSLLVNLCVVPFGLKKQKKTGFLFTKGILSFLITNYFAAL